MRSRVDEEGVSLIIEHVNGKVDPFILVRACDSTTGDFNYTGASLVSCLEYLYKDERTLLVPTIIFFRIRGFYEPRG